MDDPLNNNYSDEELLAIKGSRGGGRYLPPGGGGPGPGPGGGFGGSGSGFFGSGMPGMGVEGFGGWPKRKVVRGPNGDIQISLSPLDSSQDTVPAMLSPGEFVVNRNSVAMPGVKPMLEQLNMAGGGAVPGGSPAYEAGRQMGMMMRQGRQAMACGGEVKPQGYAGGGEVVDAGVPMSGTVPVNAQVLQWLIDHLSSPMFANNAPSWFQSPLSVTDFNAERSSGGGPMVMRSALDRSGLVAPGAMPMVSGIEVKPQGYAFGGVVRQQGGYQRTPQMPLGAPRMPVQPQTTVGATPRSGAAPMAPPAPNVGPGPVNSGMGPNPWQEAPISPGSPNPGDEWMNRISALLRDWGRQGAFDMNGNPALMAALRSEATTNADALRRRAALNAQALGLDAGQRGSYAMQSDLNTQGGVANTLNDAVLKQLLGQQSFGQGLLGKMYDANTQAWLAQLTKWMGQK